MSETAHEHDLPNGPGDAANDAGEVGENVVHQDTVPEWAAEMTNTLKAILDKISGTPDPEPIPEPEVHEESHHHEVEDSQPGDDDSPIKLPWTHVNPFSHKDED